LRKAIESSERHISVIAQELLLFLSRIFPSYGLAARIMIGGPSKSGHRIAWKEQTPEIGTPAKIACVTEILCSAFHV